MKTHFQTQIFKVRNYLNENGVINEIRAHNDFGVQFGSLPEIMRNITDIDKNLTFESHYGKQIRIYTKVVEFDLPEYNETEKQLF